MSDTLASYARPVRSGRITPRRWPLALSVVAHVAVIASVAVFLGHRAEMPEGTPDGAVELVFAPALPEPDPVDVATTMDFAPPAADASTPKPLPLPERTVQPAAAPASVPARPRPSAPQPRMATAAPSQFAVQPTEAPPALIPARPVAGMESDRPPVYPESARRRGEQGRVMLRVDVSAEGLPLDVNVAEGSGFASLDAAALGAVRQWRFIPASRGGTTVAATAQVPIRFRLSN